MKKIKDFWKEFWKNFRLKYHSCDKHSKVTDSFSTSFSSDDGTSVGVSSRTMFRCEICGKRFDVD